MNHDFSLAPEYQTSAGPVVRRYDAAGGASRLLVRRSHLRRTAKLNDTELQAVLDRAKASFPQYAWMGLADVDGVVLASTGGILLGENVQAMQRSPGAPGHTDCEPRRHHHSPAKGECGFDVTCITERQVAFLPRRVG